MTDKKKDKPKSKVKTLANSITKYVKDEDLLDTPSRLFRAIQNHMGMNPIMWAKLLREHLEHTIVMKDKEKEKKARMHQAGNYKTAFFNNNTLSWNKLLEGVSILQAKKCKFTLELTMMDDTVISHSETCIIKNCRNSGEPIVTDETESK